MKKNKVINMAVAAMFTAMIFVLTRFVAIPVGTGYIHLGDTLVYLAASIIGGPSAIFAAAVGEALADVMSGWVSYAPATIIIKGLMVIPFSLVGGKSEKIISTATSLMTVPAGLLTIGGYFVADMIINKAYAVVNIPGNAVQAVASAILFVVIGAAFDAAKLKKNLFK